MRNITFCADGRLIRLARDRARKEKTTLNNESRTQMAGQLCRKGTAGPASRINDARVARQAQGGTEADAQGNE